ncbi:hypothetical protein MKX01_012725 [Papaver californicum]|nr:hypothetical protein MKX01_012725 [Papaver californicum]
MASSSLNLLRLPSIQPSPHRYRQQTFRKPFSSPYYSSPPTPHFNLRSSSKTTLRASSLSHPNSLITQQQKPQFISLNPLEKPNKRMETICMASSSSSSYSRTVPARDRLVSALVYLIPFLNGLNYGTYLFARYPILELAFDPIVPLLSFYKSIPSVGLFAFLTLYIGIVRDRNFSRFVRFNSLQAMVMDFMLVVPSLARTILVNSDPFAEEIGLKFQLLKVSHDVTFIVIVLAFLYAFSRCVLGRIPEFPGVTNAVEWQIFAVDRQL